MYLGVQEDHRFTAADVRLPGAHITGQLHLSGADLKAGLVADRVQVDGGMYLDVAGTHRFTAAGPLALVGSKVFGRLVVWLPGLCRTEANSAGLILDSASLGSL